MRHYKKIQSKRQHRRPRLPKIDSQGHIINQSINGFARQIAEEEFGHHRHFRWSRWASFRDTTPAQLARTRAL